jgi:RNA-directed DNA polymerase
MRKRYPLDQSPLYRLNRRKGLAELLMMPLEAVERLANSNPPRYRCFERVVNQGHGPPKKRLIEWPYADLQSVQRRIARLLDRIEPPGYIHSGFRGRSYVTNAQEHEVAVRVAKIDIRKFFPTASAQRVYDCFRFTFECSSDVSAVLMKLTTKDGHLPTGGSASSIVSFFAYKHMFDEISELARARGLAMSCCVDDMTFSGDSATGRFLNDVRAIIVRHGLRIHKRRTFEPMQPKVVTGVVLTSQGRRLPNRRRKKLHENYQALNEETELEAKVKLAEQLLGRATEAAQVEPLFRVAIPWAATALGSAKRELRSATRAARREG